MSISPLLIAEKIPHVDGKKLRPCFIHALAVISEYKKDFAQQPIIFLEILFSYLINSAHSQFTINNIKCRQGLYIFFTEIKKYLCRNYMKNKNTSELIFNTYSIIEMFLYHYHSYGAVLYVDNDNHYLYTEKAHELLTLYKLHPYYLFIYTKKNLVQGFQIYCKNMRIESSINRIIFDIKKRLGVASDEL